jgi:two-component system, NarL family, invasion response regulator UvrY
MHRPCCGTGAKGSVDDPAVVRAGYRRFLQQEPGLEIVAEAGSGEEAYDLLQNAAVDVVI